MPMQLVRKWQKEIIVRVIADILMINFTFFTAFIARFLGLIVFGFIADAGPNHQEPGRDRKGAAGA